ncbi:MAG TPA: SCO family protein [Jatrophihabitans sp.]|nr:SCO family protein [Jatrophihabitans sp.]
MSRRHALLAPLLALVLAVGLAACSSSGSSGAPAVVQQTNVSKYAGIELTPPQPRPSFTLTDTSGKRFAFGATTAGHPTFLFFGYTHCPDVCPTTLADVRLALQKVPADLAKRTYVVFVTTDIKRDTAPVIQRWLGSFAAGSQATFVGLRGSQAQIDAAQAAAHVAVAEDGGATHSAELLLYGPDDYARVAFSATPQEQQEIEHDLPLVAQSKSWPR